MNTLSLWRFAPVALVALLLASCTNTGRHYVNSMSNERLETEILPNGSKMFVYQIGRMAPAHASRQGMNGQTPMADIATAERYRRGARPERISEDKLRANADYVVATAGYCREGFFMLDRSLVHNNLWVRGECRDSATQDDLHVFGANKILDAQAWNKSAN
ncbi:MAG: hypothetical protein ACI4NJ_12315 [Cellvibrio sp.]